MSSTLLNTLKTLKEDIHAVGSLNNWGKDVINLGAVVADEKIDNWEIVELGFNAAGERTCSQLSDETEKGYLIASVEDYMGEYESLRNFYNVKGERARIVKLVANKRFEVSNFKLANTSKPIKNGMVAHWDISDKKYIISNDTSNHSGYAAAGNKFIVVDAAGSTLDGLKTVRFEIAE